MNIKKTLASEPAKTQMMEFFIKLFCASMIMFYVLWIMFHDESGTPYPAKFEIALLMIFVSVLCNIGFYISLGYWKKKFKKLIVTFLLIAAFFNFFMFISFAHTPFELLDEGQWSILRIYLAYGSVLFSLVISVFVLRYKK